MYREFAELTLSDLATREAENDTITFRGNHVSTQHRLPVRSPAETAEQFAARLAKFRASLPRGSDLSERLAIAVRAFALAGEDSFSAADRAREILHKVPAEKRAEYEHQGIGHAFRPIDNSIGITRRNRRTKDKKVEMTPEESQAHTIRTQASRFIRQHKDFDALFESRLGSFRFQFWRDAEWYEAAEKSAANRVTAFEKCIGPFDWYTAMPLCAAAYLYHEQDKFAPALVYYHKAIRAAHNAVMHEDLRAFVLHWLRVGAERCANSEGIVRMPPWRGPWIPAENNRSDGPV